MPLTPSFSVSQNIGAPSTLVITDTSTGSDPAITKRVVYIQKSDGTYLVPTGTSTDYIEWALAATSKSIDVLDRDYALSITVKWLNVSDGIVAQTTEKLCFTLYSEQFLYELTQSMAATPSIPQDTVYYQNKMQLRCEVDSANNAVTIGGDIAASQNCLNRAYEMMQNESKYF